MEIFMALLVFQLVMISNNLIIGKKENWFTHNTFIDPDNPPDLDEQQNMEDVITQDDDEEECDHEDIQPIFEGGFLKKNPPAPLRKHLLINTPFYWILIIAHLEVEKIN